MILPLKNYFFFQLGLYFGPIEVYYHLQVFFLILSGNSNVEIHLKPPI